MKTLVVCSGGLDSVSLAHVVAAELTLSRLVSFDYGQRHVKEFECAAAAAQRLGVPHHLIDLTSIGRVLTGSALTDDIDGPDGHYAEDTMKVTIVPNRSDSPHADDPIDLKPLAQRLRSLTKKPWRIAGSPPYPAANSYLPFAQCLRRLKGKPNV